MANKKTILVLDDEAIILASCKQILEEEGYKVKAFVNFTLGLEVYRELYPEIDAVVLDMYIHDHDYLTTIPALLAVNPKVKIIAMSGDLKLENLSKYQQGKIIGFLGKPFDKAEILEILDKLSVDN